MTSAVTQIAGPMRWSAARALRRRIRQKAVSTRRTPAEKCRNADKCAPPCARRHQPAATPNRQVHNRVCSVFVPCRSSRPTKTPLTLPTLWTHRTRPRASSVETISAKQRRARSVNRILGFRRRLARRTGRFPQLADTHGMATTRYLGVFCTPIQGGRLTPCPCTASAQLAEQSVQAIVQQKGEPMEFFLQHRRDLVATLALPRSPFLESSPFHAAVWPV